METTNQTTFTKINEALRKNFSSKITSTQNIYLYIRLAIKRINTNSN
jgi:hypothetical protein